MPSGTNSYPTQQFKKSRKPLLVLLSNIVSVEAIDLLKLLLRSLIIRNEPGQTERQSYRYAQCDTGRAAYRYDSQKKL